VSPEPIANFLFKVSVWVLPLVVAVTFHEVSHGIVANWLGDDTAYRQGRINFNPLAHIDPLGTIILPGILLLFGAPFLFGYAKPVPVNFARLNKPKRDMVFVAAAGPGMNILLAVASGLLNHIVPFTPIFVRAWFDANLGNSIVINVILAMFNMLPLPPLDGGRILVGLLPLPLARRVARVERWGMFILIVILFILPTLMHLNLISWLLGWPAEQLYDLILRLTGND
jgi:Zn-dependent protease